MKAFKDIKRIKKLREKEEEKERKKRKEDFDYKMRMVNAYYTCNPSGDAEECEQWINRLKEWRIFS